MFQDVRVPVGKGHRLQVHLSVHLLLAFSTLILSTHVLLSLAGDGGIETVAIFEAIHFMGLAWTEFPEIVALE